MKNYIYTGVMALALMGLTACSSDSESEITPQKRETVKTQFAIAGHAQKSVDVLTKYPAAAV